MKFCKKLLIFILLFVFTIVFTISLKKSLKAKTLEHDLRALNETVLTFPLPFENFRGYFLLNPVLVNQVKDLSPLVFRAGVTYEFKPAWKFRVGYDNHLSKKSGESFKSVENRIWQQLIHSRKFRYAKLEGRLMFEQRFLTDESLSLRIRPRITASIPMTKDEKFYFILQAESFVYLNKNGNPARDGFESQWITLALGRKLTQKVKLETGYRLIYQRAPTQERGVAGHAFFTALVINL